MHELQAIQEQVRLLSVNSDNSTGMAVDRMPVPTDTAHLIVSTGGSGADLLLETKGLITQRCCDISNRGAVPGNVAYLALDTDRHTEGRTSSSRTGSVSFGPGEVRILRRRAAPPGAIPGEVRSWLDADVCLPPHENGSGAIRQVGRCLLFLNVVEVFERMKDALAQLLSGGEVRSLNIYLLCGVCGGTGGGTFLDLAYLLRRAAQEVLDGGRFAPHLDIIRVFAYFLMPDVSALMAPDEATLTALLCNGGAALQELEHAMGIHSAGGSFRCVYSASHSIEVNTKEPPFDYVHLICASAYGGLQTRDPYARCLNVVANGIFSLIADPRFAWHYSTLPVVNPDRYLSLGASGWEIPDDQLIRYVFTLLFKDVGRLLEQKPTQAEIDALYRSLGIDLRGLLAEMEEGFLPPLRADYFTWEELFGRELIHLEDYLGLEDWMDLVQRRLETKMQNLPKQIRQVLGREFVDTDHGPIWVMCAVRTTHDGLTGLDRLLMKSVQEAVDLRGDLLRRMDLLQNEIEQLSMGRRSIFRPKRDYIREYIALWNEYVKLHLDVFCLDLLLRDGMYQNARAGYATIRYHLFEISEDWLKQSEEILKQLSAVVRENKYLMAARHDAPFSWNVPGVPNLDEILAEKIRALGIHDPDVMRAFLNGLLQRLNEGTDFRVDGMTLLGELLEKEAGSILHAGMEDILKAHFNAPGALAHSVEHELIPTLLEKAVPLFLEVGGAIPGWYWTALSVPDGCPEIHHGAAPHTHAAVISIGAQRRRIDCISVQQGIAPEDYLLYGECQEVLARRSGQAGLHLFGNTGAEWS